ncbi:hypothetical protein HDV06_004738 [Boothiomyces sp. JEL0866]|nr:hypothetical protein HDV06_004727 [Boothiomyces sp. JEL0866]KAJ3320960.1 hypothetical protein HDV06_004738 [Boothiomyces sp. JEL0866]
MTLQLAATGVGLSKSRIAFTDSSAQLNEEGDGTLDLKRQTKSEVQSILKSALKNGSNEEYQEALLLEKYRDALLAQARELQGELHSDLNARARRIAPRVYGWSDKAIPGLSKKYKMNGGDNNLDYEELWNNLRSVAAHEYTLEDPSIANEFFDELKELMLGKNLKRIKPATVLQNYPWLENKKLFQSELSTSVVKLVITKMIKKQNKKTVKPRDPNKASIAKQRFEEYMRQKELELEKIMNDKFHANPIPASSILPKYKSLIENSGTRSMTIRNQAIQKNIQRLKEKERIPKTQACFSNYKKPNINPILSKALHNLPAAPKSDLSTPKKANSQPFENMIRHHLEQAKKAKETKKAILESEKEEQKPEKFSNISKNPPSIQAKSTHSFHLLVQYRKMSNEAKQLIQDIQEEEEQNLKIKKKETAEKIRSRINRTSQLTNKINKELKLKRHSQDQLRMEDDYKKRIEEMNERIANRLCLFEEAKLKSANNKVKSQIHTILKEAGLKASDYE